MCFRATPLPSGRCRGEVATILVSRKSARAGNLVHEDYVSAYDLGRFAESARFVRHYPEQNPALRDLLPSITTPTQIVAGRDDDLVPWSNNEYLHDLLPNSEIHPLDAGHFAWEQAAEAYGRLVALLPHCAALDRAVRCVSAVLAVEPVLL